MPGPFDTLARAMDPNAPKPKPAAKVADPGQTRAGQKFVDRSKDPAYIAALEAAKKRQQNYLTTPPKKPR